MNKLLFFISFLLSGACFAQPVVYSSSNAHSHNDYEQLVPLFAAYGNTFGSIEADIFWHNNELLVAHTTSGLANRRTLENLYLKPLDSLIRKNKGFVYAVNDRRLQLMIDIKTEAVTTLAKLVELLQQYPAIINCATLQITISGNRPDVAAYDTYPAFIHFDGELYKEYPAAALKRIVMMSDNLKKYTSWNGYEVMTAQQATNLHQLIKRSHALGKPVRFWGAPDHENAWKQLMSFQVDYINTDSIKALSTFLAQPETKKAGLK